MDDNLKKFLKLVKKSGGLALPMSEALSVMEDDDDDDDDKTVIGRVSPELLKKYRALDKQRDQLYEEKQVYARQLAFEAKKQLDAKYDDRDQELDDAKDALWSEIAKELKIELLQDMSINMRNGDIMVSAEDLKPSDDTPIQ